MSALELIVLRCRDIEASRRFYEGIGLAFVAEQHGTGPRHYAAEIGGTVLELYPRPADSSVDDHVRLGFSVADLPAVLAALGMDPSASLYVAGDPDTAVVRDPDHRPCTCDPSDRPPGPPPWEPLMQAAQRMRRVDHHRDGRICRMQSPLPTGVAELLGQARRIVCDSVRPCPRRP